MACRCTVFNQRSVEEIFSHAVPGGGDGGRRPRRGVALLSACERGWRRSSAPRPCAAAPAPRVFRGVGRAAHQRHPLGVGADRHRRRRRLSFPSCAVQALGKDRIIADAREIVRRNPDIVIGSWCGKKFRPEKVRGAAGLGAGARGARRPAVRDQVGRHPAAGAGGAHRRRAPDALDPQGLFIWRRSNSAIRRRVNSRRTLSRSNGRTLSRQRRPIPQSSQRSTPKISTSARILGP